MQKMRRTQAAFMTKKLRAILDSHHKSASKNTAGESLEKAADNAYSEASNNSSAAYLTSIRRSTSFKKGTAADNDSSKERLINPSFVVTVPENGSNQIPSKRPEKRRPGKHSFHHCPLNKTAINWKISHAVPNTDNDMRKTKCASKCKERHEVGILPIINIRAHPPQQFIASESIPTKEDEYIRYIAQKKRSRVAAVSITRTHGINGKPKERPEVKAFDWNGVHFEVNVGRDHSMDSGRSMKKKYANDMNLIFYNFNAGGSREVDNERQQSRRQNKTSMNFYKQGARSKRTNSPSTSETNSIEAETKTTNKTFDEMRTLGNHRADKELTPLASIANNVSKKLHTIISNYKYNKDEGRLLLDKNIGSQIRIPATKKARVIEGGLEKLRNKVQYYKAQLQEDISEQSSEFEQ